MPQINNYKDIVDTLLSLKHSMVSAITFAPDYDLDNGQDNGFPLIYISPMPYSFNLETGSISYDFQLLVLDKTNLENTNLKYVLNKTQGILNDYCAYIHRNLYAVSIINPTPINLQYDSQLDGWQTILTISTHYDVDMCNINITI
jgi:hypothetical protein